MDRVREPVREATVALRRCWAEVDSCDAVALLAAERLAAEPGRSVIGFVYAPRAALWVRLGADGQLEPPPGGAIPSDIFELRLFDGAREWRWREEGGRGVAACVAEAPLALPRGWESEEIQVDALDRSYLLWGTTLGAASSGWSRLATPRTGPFLVPIEVPAQEGVAVVTRIYLGRIDPENGNAGVVDERLMCLREARFKPAREGA